MKRTLAKIDKSLLFWVIFLAVFGLVMIFSASNVKATVDFDNPYLYFFRQLKFLAFGIVIFILILNIPTKVYVRFDKVIAALTIGVLVACLVLGNETRNARSWIFGVQPSEFAKLAVVICMATFYEKIVRRKQQDINNVIYPLIFAGSVVGLVALQPDFGTASILLGIAGLLFLSVPITKFLKIRVIEICIGLVAVLLLLIIGSGKFGLLQTQIDRFTFLNPCSRYTQPTGYQVCNGYIATNNGGLFGLGLGRSTQKYLYLPEAHNDFIFPIVVEETGLLMGLIVILIYLYIIWCCIKISKQSSTLRGSMIAYGIACFFFLQVIINLIGILGLAPLTGVPLPFLSAGGSMLLTSIIAVALVERVALESFEDQRRRALSKK